MSDTEIREVRFTAAGGRVSDEVGGGMYPDGAGYIGRRNVTESQAERLNDPDALRLAGLSNPIELLLGLVDTNPELSKAIWDLQRLANAPKRIRFRAMTTAAPTAEEKAQNPEVANMQPDALGRYPAREAVDGTAVIDEFFENLPDEIGGQDGLVSQNLLMTAVTGMCACEYVPGAGPVGTGEIWPIYTPSLMFRRVSGKLTLHQKQNKLTPKVGRGQRNRGKIIGFTQGAYYKPLPMERTFWASFDCIPGDPYGRPPFGPALTEILVNLAFMRDLALAWFTLGHPDKDVTFDFQTWTNLGKLVGKKSDEEAVKWALEMFEKAKKEYRDKKPGAAYFHDTGSTVQSQANTWPDVPGVYNLFRWRLITALKSLPTLFGVSEGKTETWSTVEFRIYTSGIDSILECALRPILKTLRTYLQRVKGLPYTVEAEVEPIQTSDRKKDAEAEALEIKNAQEKVKSLWWTNSQASNEITGSPPVSDEEPAYMTMPTVEIETARAKAGGNGEEDGNERVDRQGNNIATAGRYLTAEEIADFNARVAYLQESGVSREDIERFIRSEHSAVNGVFRRAEYHAERRENARRFEDAGEVEEPDEEIDETQDGDSEPGDDGQKEEPADTEVHDS